jgi:hypothetical protein
VAVEDPGFTTYHSFIDIDMDTSTEINLNNRYIHFTVRIQKDDDNPRNTQLINNFTSFCVLSTHHSSSIDFATDAVFVESAKYMTALKSIVSSSDMYEAKVTVLATDTSQRLLLLLHIDFMLGDDVYTLDAEYTRFEDKRLTSSGVLKTHKGKYVIIKDRPI